MKIDAVEVDENFNEICRRIEDCRYDRDIQTGRLVAFVANWFRKRYGLEDAADGP